MYAIHAQARTRVIRETRTLEEVSECFEEIEEGNIKAHIVFDLRSSAPAASVCNVVATWLRLP